MNPGDYDYETRKLGKCHSRVKPKDKYTLKDFTKEDEDWIPEEAFKAAHDFRNRCASSVSQALMNQLLTDLNAIWRDREKKRLARVQNQAHREIQYLRRQISFRKPYDQVKSETDMSRLKKDLKETQRALRENVAVIEETNKKGPLEGLQLVDSTVKFTNQIMEEKRRLQDQVDKLNQKIEVMEETRRGDGVDREKFYEGASWLAQ
jgi:hypothetical protein